MISRQFGRLGWSVSEVGFGLWGMGGWTGSNDEQSMAALDAAVRLGCTFFDTALAYGNGKSEQLLGRVLRHVKGQTGNLVSPLDGTPIRVATKIPPKNQKWPALASYALDDVFPADHIRRSTETSLANLKLETIDLQQFHVWSDAWARDERWQRAVDDLKGEGLIRGFGISVNRWEPRNVLDALATGLVDAVQVVYNIFDQNPEDELFPACRARQIAVIARVPFDEGSLTGALTRDSTWPANDWRNLYFAPDKLATILDHVESLKVDLPTAMSMPEAALRFILANRDVTTVIPGMRRTQHVEENLGVSDGWQLSPHAYGRMRRHRWTRSYVVV